MVLKLVGIFSHVTRGTEQQSKKFRQRVMTVEIQNPRYIENFENLPIITHLHCILLCFRFGDCPKIGWIVIEKKPQLHSCLIEKERDAAKLATVKLQKSGHLMKA
ncbi:hypothetical protein T01_6222 [Trichinella spiralis]|uniref:Uncharacterized protein n=1 Tax=Trichinella spiralis TaxID=6334 RepID=A0A0V1BXT6_TRISP|nr:hypothetical protein T01_6222 [Trichinella spiralis]